MFFPHRYMTVRAIGRIDLSASASKGALLTRSKTPNRDRISPGPHSGHRRRKSTSDVSTSRSGFSTLGAGIPSFSQNPSPPPREIRRQRKSASEGSSSRSPGTGASALGTTPPNSRSPLRDESSLGVVSPVRTEEQPQSSDHASLVRTQSGTITALSSTGLSSSPPPVSPPPRASSNSPVPSERKVGPTSPQKSPLVRCLSADIFRWRSSRARARALRHAVPSEPEVEVMVAKRAPSVTQMAQRMPSVTQRVPSVTQRVPSVTSKPINITQRSQSATARSIGLDSLDKTWPGPGRMDDGTASEIDDGASVITTEEEDLGQLRGLYPEALLVLKMLAGMGMEIAVVSRCAEAAGDRAMISLGIDRYFSLRVFTDEPRDAQLNAVARMAGRAAEDLIYFDMSSTNVAMCERTGAYPVRVSKHRGVTRDVVERACKGAAMHKTLSHALLLSRRAG
eukprot:jgi/Mesvir1/19776/Mv13076-RA.1